MPLLKLYTLPLPAELAPSTVLAALATAVAPILGVRPTQVISLHIELQSGSYCLGENACDWHGPHGQPPVLDIAAFAGRSDSQIEQALQAAAATLATQLGLEAGNAFVTYTELQSGRVFTGGSVRR
ncbi:MAG: hypothetical protein EXR77_15070 [Myxococcales bacterium]|nr:hypothetical protein [Myxococcales bacterium]